jgi:hypothetical protein
MSGSVLCAMICCKVCQTYMGHRQWHMNALDSDEIGASLHYELSSLAGGECQDLFSALIHVRKIKIIESFVGRTSL